MDTRPLGDSDLHITPVGFGAWAIGGGGGQYGWGAQDDAALARIYAGAAVYAQGSRSLARSVEGFGLTFLEAAFHGCAVAAYRSGGVAEAVLDGETGLLVPEGDEAALAEAIRRLLEDDGLRARLGARGQEFARGLHWETAAEAPWAAARRD